MGRIRIIEPIHGPIVAISDSSDLLFRLDPESLIWQSGYQVGPHGPGANLLH